MSRKNIVDMNTEELIARRLETETPWFSWSSSFDFNVVREQESIRERLETLLRGKNKGQVPPVNRPFTSDSHAMDYIVDEMLQQARAKKAQAPS